MKITIHNHLARKARDAGLATGIIRQLGSTMTPEESKRYSEELSKYGVKYAGESLKQKRQRWAEEDRNR